MAAYSSHDQLWRVRRKAVRLTKWAGRDGGDVFMFIRLADDMHQALGGNVADAFGRKDDGDGAILARSVVKERPAEGAVVRLIRHERATIVGGIFGKRLGRRH